MTLGSRIPWTRAWRERREKRIVATVGILKHNYSITKDDIAAATGDKYESGCCIERAELASIIHTIANGEGTGVDASPAMGYAVTCAAVNRIAKRRVVTAWPFWRNRRPWNRWNRYARVCFPGVQLS